MGFNFAGNRIRRASFVAVSALAFAVAVRGAGQQSAAPAAATQTAGEHFKNVKVLKDIPADQLIPSMQFISAALGVECEFCHVPREFEKDDKKEKQAARQMISMMQAINRDNFKGKTQVTCNSCHNGQPHPAAVPVIAEASAPAPKDHTHDHERGAEGAAPPDAAADATITRYIREIGGTDSLAKLKSREETGTIDMGGHAMPVTIYQKGPAHRATMVNMGDAENATVVNGDSGWLGTPGRGTREMDPTGVEAAKVDAALLFGQDPRTIFKKFRPGRPETVDGRDMDVINATADTVSAKLYFDKKTGLLARMLRLTDTPLGKNPARVDFADYKEFDGVKTPTQWTIARPGGSRFTITIKDVKQNVEIPDSRFTKPASQDKPAH